MSLSLQLKAGALAPIELPPQGAGAQSALAFSMAKAGSTLLFDILHDLAPKAGCAYFSPDNALWSLGNDPRSSSFDPSGLFRLRGYCYGGFRIFPTYRIPIIDSVPIMLLVRDPKDMLVSNYFSNAYSHRPPSNDKKSEVYQRFMKRRERIQNTNINEYVRTIIGNYQKMMASYRGLWHRTNVKVFRYEDIIEEKRAWVDEIQSHFGWSIADDEVEAIIARYDLFPDDEQPNAHVRQVKPGNFREHLSKQTIIAINAAFAEDLAILGYDR